MPIKIKLKKLNENAQLPKKTNEGDFCYDVYATEREEIMPNVFKYKLGFSYEIVRDYVTIENNVKSNIKTGDICFETTICNGLDINLKNSPLNISIDLRPRSSIYKTGLSLANSVGTLDEFFRGEACAIFYRVIPGLPVYEVGERVGQIKLGFTIPCEFEWADDIDNNTERGQGGFGHSGNK